MDRRAPRRRRLATRRGHGPYLLSREMVSVHGAPVLEKPFLMLRNFIESMNAIANRPRPPGPDISWIEYDGRKFKSLGLNDVDHGRYRDCVDALLRAIGGKPSARTISPESVDAMIRRALVDAVRPGSTAKSPRQAFDRRLAVTDHSDP